MGRKELSKPIRVLALCSYPVEAAATRFRLQQFVEPLLESGIELEISPFIDSATFRKMYSGDIPGKVWAILTAFSQRLIQLPKLRQYDLVLVQREAMMFGPAVFEWVANRMWRLPQVLDLDDATYIRYVSPTYGRIGSLLKFFGKTDKLIARSSAVICGNRFIADHAIGVGARTAIIPTVVDTDLFRPADRGNDVPVIGWVGTHSTFPFLEKLFPVLERLSAEAKFRLLIVGSGREQVGLKGIDVDLWNWDLDREISDFQSIDIGLYPLSVISSANEEWLAGKSGFKAIQYMAVGVPFVMTPLGVCAEIGEPGATHLNADTDEDWYNSLKRLVLDPDLRTSMGAKGREYSLKNYSLDRQADLLADVLRSAAKDETSIDN